MIGHRFQSCLTPSVIFILSIGFFLGLQPETFASNAGHVGVRNYNVTFGNVVIGRSKSATDSLVNHTSSPVTIASVQVVGSGFEVTGVAFPIVLAPGTEVPFTIEFQPAASGSPTATIAFIGQNGQTYVSLSASGSGIPAGKLAPNPSPVNFGNTSIGANQTSTVKLTNNGGADLTITQATLSGAGFAMSNLALPVKLHAGDSASATITFAPTEAGNFSGSVTFATRSTEIEDRVRLPFTGWGVHPGALTPSPKSLGFGNIQVGNSASQTATLTNTGGTPITISTAVAAGAGFSVTGIALPVTLGAGQSTSFKVLFSPAAGGSATGSITIVSNEHGQNVNIPLSGDGTTAAAGSLASNPSTLTFGNVPVGNSSSLSETLTNSGSSAVTISQANVTGSGFSISNLPLPLTLAANQSVTFTTTFAPKSGGNVSGGLSVTSNALNSNLNVVFSGTGAAPGQLAVSPASLSFGNVAVGSTASLNGTLTAGSTGVNVTSAGINNSEFVVSGISLPMTLAAGQSATFAVTFKPQASGATSASLAFSSNAANASIVQSITGSGTAPAQHTVDLTWNGSDGAVGYNVYRGTTSGGPYSLINPSLNDATAFTDNTVASGQTYYYVATAVDESSNESGYSNETQAIVPNP